MALLAQGPWTAVLVVVICTTVAMLLQGLVQPRVTGRAVGVSASVSFLSVLFWSWVLGAAGALLSVPMTLLVKELLVDADPRARWANAFLADTVDAAVEPPANRVGTGPSPTESAPASKLTRARSRQLPRRRAEIPMRTSRGGRRSDPHPPSPAPLRSRCAGSLRRRDRGPVARETQPRRIPVAVVLAPAQWRCRRRCHPG